ncbi:MAG: DUF262 domain-containing protein [Lactobacillaceae bacterium]
MATKVKSADHTIREYFLKVKAEVPKYQRGYSWGSDQIDDFLNDLYDESKKASDSKYFFGPVITTNSVGEDERAQIIDGQQRLTTSIIFFAVLRDILGQFKGNDNAIELRSLIQSEAIGNGDRYHPLTLIQTGSIQEYFKSEIQQYQEKNCENFNELKKSTFSGKNSKGRGADNIVIRAYNQLLESVLDFTETVRTTPEKVALIEKLFNVFGEHFFIVEISSPDRGDAFQIFQTINARGLDLSPADLIKSDFFGNSGVFGENVTTNWNEMQSILGNLDVTDFIRYVWNATQEFATKRNLYRLVAKKIKTHEEVNIFVDKLKKLSVSYVEMLGETVDGGYLDDSIDATKLINILRELNALSFRQYAPIYLSLIQSGKTIEQVLKIMKSVARIMLRNKIAKQGTNRLEKLLAQQAVLISNSADTFVLDQVEEKLKSEQETDLLTRTRLLSYEYENDLNLVCHILRYIENDNPSEKGLLSVDRKNIHIEHIMPQHPRVFEEWGVDEELHGQYLWKLGNLTLLGSEYNMKASNKGFQSKKKDYYPRSDIYLTTELTNYDIWNTESIETRTELLVEKYLTL